MEFHKAKSKELRKTNFFMGKFHPEYKTAYVQAYKDPKSFSVISNDDYKSTSTHFTFGNSRKTQQSEAHSRYKSQNSRIEASPKGIDRLETSKHHFDLGSEAPKFNTTANDFYKTSPGHSPGDYNLYLKQNRKMNFTFGNENKAKNSITKTDFSPKRLNYDKNVRDEIRYQQRSTHFNVGDEKNDYKTNAKDEFFDKSKSVESRSLSPNKLGLNLGEYKPTFLSVNQQEYSKKPLTAQVNTEKTVSTMLGTHFVLGESESFASTVAKESFSARKITDISRILPETKKTSVVLGNNRSS